MKRKRGDEDGNQQNPRPIFKKEELLTTTCELVLEYNRVFQEEYSDLTLYHHAERFLEIDRLLEYNKCLYNIVSNVEPKSKYEIMSMFQ